ncbi:DsbA family protein [Hyphomicrobium sp.]|jgi:protein-disulfide isomerase|uniref:DsbA family protein n=1 Tax=Hyphomicrobium sp. TaxID=82 RepID=UPI003569C76A
MILKSAYRNRVRAMIASKKLSGLALGLALLAVIALAAAQFGNGSARAESVAPTAGGTAFTDEQKKALGDIIKDYLIKNPEIMFEVQNALDEKSQKEQDTKLKAFMASNAKTIYRSADAAVAGDPQGDVTVVEFFDYNCGYCKRGLPEVQKLINDDKKVRFVFKELPILAKGSEEAARVALAAKRQGKYWEFHQAMLGSKGQANEASALKVAESLGLDMDKIKTDMAGDSVKTELQNDLALAKQLGVNGTPHFLVGDKAIPGAPDDLHDQLEALVTGYRKTGCSMC